VSSFSDSSLHGPARLRSPRRWLLAIFCALLVSTLRASDDQATVAYRVKAGFLYNFLKFTDWPDQPELAGVPFRIAIAADDATYALIASALSGKTVGPRPVVIERLGGTPGGAPLHMVFITRTASANALELARHHYGSPVLTIGESDGFARSGGILNFVFVDEAVRFEVNLAAAQQAGLRISSRLSKMAILVRSAP
jgi:hypothetical protein